MTMVEYRDDAFVWPKGATYWGEPLPYLQPDDSGKQWVMYGDWWSEERIGKLNNWAVEAQRFIRNVFGNDRHLEIRARAKVFMDSADRHREQGKLNLTGLFANWHPTAEQAAEVERLVHGLKKTRALAMEEIEKAYAANVGEIHDDLPEDRDRWNEVNLMGAAFRLPKLLMLLVRMGEIPDPGTIVPEKALV